MTVDTTTMLDQVKKTLNSKIITDCEFSHELINVLDDGRHQVKIDCFNEFLKEELSVVLNDDCIALLPFGNAHVAKIMAKNKRGEIVKLFGYFPEENLRSEDELNYIDGICKTLTAGATEETFGAYD